MGKPTESLALKGRVAGAPRYRYLFLLATLCGGAFLLLTVHNGGEMLMIAEEPLPSNWHRQHLPIHDSFTIKTEGCSIPALNPFDKEIRQFVKPPHTIGLCENHRIKLVTSNETHIRIHKEYLKYYRLTVNANETNDITCCYEPFYRPTTILDITSGDVDERVEYLPCTYFSDTIEVMNEFVLITCAYNSRIIYKQYFLFAPKKPLITNTDEYVDHSQNQSYNVIILGIDSVSRLNFYRTMPKTLAFLQNKNAIELKGYNKVADNTFPNLVPMLFGFKETDLRKTCWHKAKSTFDNCPFIWDWFKDMGYYTAFGEDSGTLGTFNYLRPGFSGTPTDYYIHTFIREAEQNVGNNKASNTFLCMGNKYFYKVLLDYIESLTQTLKDSKLFGFFWEVSMSHDYLNYPMFMDKDYVRFFKRLDKVNYLDNTIIILLSDHGIRWGGIRLTKQGRLEERLPLVSMLFPPSFEENYSIAYENLKINSLRLSTPFDIHATLLDLVNLDAIKNENIQNRVKASYANDRGISLFLPLPTNRTCKSAGIDNHWCTCHRSKKVSLENSIAHEVAISLIYQLNSLLRGYDQVCAKLELAEIMEVTEFEADIPKENEMDWQEYRVRVRASPGYGIFEATMRHHRQQWSLAGTASRLNLYGDQSHCMLHYQLKLYCYCLDQDKDPFKNITISRF